MNLFELAAKLTLDKKDYEEGIEEAAKESKSFGSKVGGALKTVGKIGVAAIGAASAAVGKLLYESVQAFGEFEQLKGGVEALFGDSAEVILNYSKSAFKTAQVSANEYMSVVTSFSGAILKSAKDSQTAAELSNMAVVDMADQANRYGKTVEEVSQTYTSLARGSFQTLDNLFGGMFAGTKTGLQEMLDTAEQYRASLGKTVSYSSDSYADIVSAIHDISEMTGVAGASLKEAGSTIQGSLNMAKAAWQNLVTGLSDSEADVGQLASNLIESLGAVAKNIVPVVKQALSGFGTAVEQIGPALIDGVVGLITDNLPELISAAMNLVNQLVQALKDNSSAIIDAVLEIVDIVVESLQDPSGLTALIDAAFEIISKLADGLGQAAPVLIPAITQLIVDLALRLVDPENVGMLIDAAISLVMGIADGLIQAAPVLIEALPPLIEALAQGFIENFPKLLSAEFELIGKLASALWGLFKQFVLDPIDQKIIQPIKDFFGRLWGSIVEFFAPIIESIKETWDKITMPIVDAWNAVMEVLQPLFDALKELFSVTWQLIKQTVGDAIDAVQEKITAIWNAIWGFLSPILQSIGNFFSNIWNGIKSTVVNAITAVWSTITSVFGKIYSAISTPLNNVKNAVSNVFTSIKNTITNVVSNALQWGQDLIGNIVQGIKNKISDVTKAVSNVASKIKSYLHFSVPDVGPLSDFDTYAPDMMQLFAEGVLNNANKVRKAVEDSFDFDDVLTYSPDVKYTVDVDRKTGDVQDPNANVIALLAQWLPQLAKAEIRLDSGALVGALAPGMDTALGGRRAYAVRGVTV